MSRNVDHPVSENARTSENGYGAGCSITELARSLGVSVATVSRAFNHAETVAPSTRQRVIEGAKRLGYSPDPRFRLMGGRTVGQANSRGRGFRGGHRTGNVGLLLSRHQIERFHASPYYGRLLSGIEGRSRDRKHNLLISALDSPDDPMLPRCIADLKVDGVLVTSDTDTELIERICRNVPLVLVNAEAGSADVSSVMPDEHQSVSLLLDHLRRLGHRRITYFHIDDASPPNRHLALRCEAFTRLTADQPEARVEVLTERHGSLEQVMAEQLQRWRRQGTMPTALLCGADSYAMATIHAGHELGVAVPDDLSVTGIDDTVGAASVYPKLTSVRQPLEAIGAAAVDMLLERIERPCPVERRVLGVNLVQRMSSKSLKGLSDEAPRASNAD